MRVFALAVITSIAAFVAFGAPAVGAATTTLSANPKVVIIAGPVGDKTSYFVADARAAAIASPAEVATPATASPAEARVDASTSPAARVAASASPSDARAARSAGFAEATAAWSADEAAAAADRRADLAAATAAWSERRANSSAGLARSTARNQDLAIDCIASRTTR